MRFGCRWLVVVLLAAAMGTWRVGAGDASKEEGVAAQALRVPDGFKAAAATAVEPYTKTGWAKEVVHEKTGIEMVFIPAGEFMMGSPDNEKGRSSNEGPVHRVKIAMPFYMGKCEVTQGEWQKTMGSNPSWFKGSDRLPAEAVSWDDCQGFIGKAGDRLRLPTEAEWEYACRAGSTGAFCFGEDEGGLGDYGWYAANSGHSTHDVGGKKANAWGLYDMHGNVYEWCQTTWQGSYKDYRNDNEPGRESDRVVRGGAFSYDAGRVRCAQRYYSRPYERAVYRGFRVVVSPY
jgi:formylglycine-generating enzyme required for sulfatase activity